MRLSEVVGKNYGDYWHSKHRYRVLKGGKASKKSTTTALGFITNLMRYPGANLLVVRAVADTHRNSTFAQLKWAQERLGVADLWENNVSPMQMTYRPNGNKIIFRGFDDVYKLASTTVDKGYLCWVWIEEAFEIVNEDDFIRLDTSVPRGQIPDNLWKQTTLTFNPWSSKHWLKRRFFDVPADNVYTQTTTFRDNEFLDDNDRAVFEEMRKNNPRLFDVAGNGNWGIMEGLVFNNWEELSFDKNNIGGDEAWKYRAQFGLDFGFSNDPTAFIALKVNPIDKIAFIFDEHSEKGMLNDDIVRMIRNKGYVKERIVADCAEPRTMAELYRLGITRVTESHKGGDSVRSGINTVAGYKLYVHPDCKNTIEELSAYAWAKDRYGNSLDKPEDKNNHLMDALRYSFKDIEYFHPEKPERKRYIRSDTITPEDMKGGWS